MDGPRSFKEAKAVIAAQLVKDLSVIETVNVAVMAQWSPAQKQRFHDAVVFFVERLKKFC
jgi:hypothetical protein